MMSVPLASPSPTPHLHHPHSRHHSRTSASPSHSPRTHSRFVSPSKNANASTSHRATPPLSQPAFAGIFSSSSSRPMASQSQTPSWATRPPAASTSASTSKAAWTARRRRQTENSSADEADDVEQQQPPRRHRALDSPTVEEAGDVNPFAAAAAASTSASAGNSPSHTRRVVARRPPLNRLNSGGKPASLGGLAAARALEDHFAQVSMTPPASFGSQTHNESPFGGTSVAAAATCYPATDLRNAAGPAARLPRTTSSFASAFDTQSPSNAFAGMRRTTRLEAARAGDVRKFGRLNDADEGSSSSSSGDERRWGQGSPSVYAAKQGRLRRGLGQDANASWPTRHTRSKTSDASDSSSSTTILAQRRAKGQAPPSFVLSRKEPSDTQLTLRTRMDLDDAEEEDDDEMGAPPSPSPPSASLSSGIDSVANLEPLLQPGPSLARRSSASASSGRQRALDDGEDLDAAPDSAPPAFSSFPRPNTSPTLAGAGAGGVPAKTRYALPPSSVGFPQPILSSVPMKTSKSTSSSSSSPYKAKRRVTISDRGARTRAISSIEDQLPSSSSPSPFFGGGEPRKRSGSARRFPEDAAYDDSGIGLGFFAPQQAENDSATPFRKGELLLSHRLGFDDTPEKGVFPIPAPPSSSKNKSAHRKSTSFDSLTSTPAKQVRRGGAGIAPPSNPFGPITKSSLANETRFSTTPGSGASSPSDVRETTSVPEGLSVGVETPAYLTPQNFKHIKPLQAAFMSTGLVSKRARGPPTASGEEVVPVPPRPNFGAAMDAGDVSLGGGAAGDVSISFAGDTSGHAADESTVSAPTPSALPPGTMAAALGLRDVVAATARRASLGGPTSTMPDTPIKKPVGAGVPGSLAHHLMGGNASSARPGPAASRPPPSVLRPTAAPSKPSMLASVASPARDELSAAGSVASSQDIDSPLLGGACDSPTLNMIGVNGGMLGGGSDGKGGPASLIETSQFSTLPHQPEQRDEPAPQSLLPTRAPLRRVKTNAAPASTPAIAVPAPSPATSIKSGKPSGITSSSLLAPRPAAARSLSDNAHHQRRSRLAPQDPSTSDSDGGPPASGAQRIIPTMRPRFPRDPSRPAGGLQRKASFGVGSGSCGLGLGLGSFDNPADAAPGSSSTVASSPATGLLDDGGLASPTLGGFWPIPSTPTRSGNHQGHSNIKWFQAARLVTTPSPPSRRQSRASLRYSRGGSKSKSSAGAVEPASSSSPAGSSDGPGPGTAREGSQGVGVGHFERHYVQLSVLGSGEFSEAVKASDVSTGIVYAVKRMKRPFTGPRDRLRHLEEVDILRHLGQPKAHPNVISLHEAWEQEAHLYIATDLCPLGTLALFLEGYGYLVGHLDEPRLWKVLVELSAGLAHIHESGVLHLDLKPANVFITAVGTLKIGDFGLASRWPPVQARDVLKGAGMGDSGDSSSSPPPALESSSHSHSHTRTNLEREGDREYLAPEIISHGHYSRAADVFSLGLIMVEAVGNVVMPDNGEAWQKLRRDDLSDVDFEGISVCMVRVIRRMLSSSAGERPEARELLEEHEVLGRVRERMARGLKVEELDQLPECGGGEVEDGEQARQDRLVDAMAVRGALIQEDEGFLAEVLMADPDPEAREMTPGKAVVDEDEVHAHTNAAAPGGLLLSTTWEEEGEEDDSGMLARHFADETWEEEGEQDVSQHDHDDYGDESMDVDEA